MLSTKYLSLHCYFTLPPEEFFQNTILIILLSCSVYNTAFLKLIKSSNSLVWTTRNFMFAVCLPWQPPPHLSLLQFRLYNLLPILFFTTILFLSMWPLNEKKKRQFCLVEPVSDSQNQWTNANNVLRLSSILMLFWRHFLLKHDSSSSSSTLS